VDAAGTWRAREGVVAAELDGDVTLFDGTETAFVLNPTAADLWDLLADPRDLPSLVAVLADRYGTTAAAITADVRTLVDELAARGLVVPA
jgi:Coenzyme PQQ synthesis protein D (PqqD)